MYSIPFPIPLARVYVFPQSSNVAPKKGKRNDTQFSFEEAFIFSTVRGGAVVSRTRICVRDVIYSETSLFRYMRNSCIDTHQSTSMYITLHCIFSGILLVAYASVFIGPWEYFVILRFQLSTAFNAVQSVVCV